MENIDFTKKLIAQTGREDELLSEILLDNNITENYTDQILTKQIYFTVNPSDHYWKKWEEYEIDSETIFHHDMMEKVMEIGRYYRNKKHMKLRIEVHFEKTDRLHCHGVIYKVPISYYPYEGMLTDISKKFHKKFGKPRLRTNICAYVSWGSPDTKYICKQNYLKPFSINFR